MTIVLFRKCLSNFVREWNRYLRPQSVYWACLDPAGGRAVKRINRATHQSCQRKPNRSTATTTFKITSDSRKSLPAKPLQKQVGCGCFLSWWKWLNEVLLVAFIRLIWCSSAGVLETRKWSIFTFISRGPSRLSSKILNAVSANMYMNTPSHSLCVMCGLHLEIIASR